MYKSIFKTVLIIFLLSPLGTPFANLVANKDYIMLDRQTIEHNVAKDKIEVVEFFSYGCPYCYMAESEIAAWLVTKPDNVTFTRIAIPRKGKWVEYARLYYALGMISAKEQERVTTLIYSAIHEQKLDFKDASTILDWAAKQNIDRHQLEKYYYSQAVSDKLTHALELAHAYNLKYIPSIYVNNRYQLVLDSTNHYQGTKDKLNELINMLSD